MPLKTPRKNSDEQKFFEYISQDTWRTENLALPAGTVALLAFLFKDTIPSVYQVVNKRFLKTCGGAFELFNKLCDRKVSPLFINIYGLIIDNENEHKRGYCIKVDVQKQGEAESLKLNQSSTSFYDLKSDGFLTSIRDVACQQGIVGKHEFCLQPLQGDFDQDTHLNETVITDPPSLGLSFMLALSIEAVKPFFPRLGITCTGEIVSDLQIQQVSAIDQKLQALYGSCELNEMGYLFVPQDNSQEVTEYVNKLDEDLSQNIKIKYLKSFFDVLTFFQQDPLEPLKPSTSDLEQFYCPDSYKKNFFTDEFDLKYYADVVNAVYKETLVIMDTPHFDGPKFLESLAKHIAGLFYKNRQEAAEKSLEVCPFPLVLKLGEFTSDAESLCSKLAGHDIYHTKLLRFALEKDALVFIMSGEGMLQPVKEFTEAPQNSKHRIVLLARDFLQKQDWEKQVWSWAKKIS